MKILNQQEVSKKLIPPSSTNLVIDFHHLLQNKELKHYDLCSIIKTHNVKMPGTFKLGGTIKKDNFLFVETISKKNIVRVVQYDCDANNLKSVFTINGLLLDSSDHLVYVKHIRHMYDYISLYNTALCDESKGLNPAALKKIHIDLQNYYEHRPIRCAYLKISQLKVKEGFLHLLTEGKYLYVNDNPDSYVLVLNKYTTYSLNSLKQLKSFVSPIDHEIRSIILDVNCDYFLIESHSSQYSQRNIKNKIYDTKSHKLISNLHYTTIKGENTFSLFTHYVSAESFTISNDKAIVVYNDRFNVLTMPPYDLMKKLIAVVWNFNNGHIENLIATDLLLNINTFYHINLQLCTRLYNSHCKQDCVRVYNLGDGLLPQQEKEKKNENITAQETTEGIPLITLFGESDYLDPVVNEL